MFERLERCWRIAATGISFAVFGIGGMLLGIVVFPLLNVLVRRPERRIGWARDLIRMAFRTFIELMRVLGILRYQIRGLEKLERGGLLILANHPTLIDTVFLMSLVRRADCVVKSSLWNNPFTGGPVRAAGYISNEGGAELIDDCIASLRAGNNLIIFPEGTRTPKSGPIELKRGAANIAVRGARAVTPVLIDCTPPSLQKGDKWWQVPRKQMHFRIEVRDDIEVGDFLGDGKSDVMAVRHLTDQLQRFFSEESPAHA